MQHSFFFQLYLLNLLYFLSKWSKFLSFYHTTRKNNQLTLSKPNENALMSLPSNFGSVLIKLHFLSLFVLYLTT